MDDVDKWAVGTGWCGGCDGTPGITVPINIGLKSIGDRIWLACAIIVNNSGLANGIRTAIAIASCCCCHGWNCMKCCGIWPLTVLRAETPGGSSDGGMVLTIDGPVPVESDGGIESRPSPHDFLSVDVDARSRSSLLHPYPILLLFVSAVLFDNVSAIDQIFVFLGVDTADADDLGRLQLVSEHGGGVTDFECTSPDASEMYSDKYHQT